MNEYQIKLISEVSLNYKTGDLNSIFRERIHKTISKFILNMQYKLLLRGF